MVEDILFPLIIGISCAIVFFIVDIYNENKTREINTSLIAGVTITYFFIILLPEIEHGVAELNLGFFKFIGILIGFSTIHLTEKLILQRVEKKSQIELKEICEKEADVMQKEKKVEKSLINKLVEKSPEYLSIELLSEKLSALEEISAVQDLWVAEERYLRKKMLAAKLNKFSYMNLLSSVMAISITQGLCLKEERKLEYSIRNELQDMNKENPSIQKLSKKLRKLTKIRQNEIESVEKKKDMSGLLMRSLLADTRDKISKEDFKDKIKELDNIRGVLAKIRKEERDLGKVLLEVNYDDLSERRATKNLYALDVCRRISRASINEEKLIAKKLMEIGQNELLILKRLSALKEISRIQMICIKEEKRLEIAILQKDEDIISEKQLTEKFITLTAVSDAQETTFLRKRSLEKSLINKLMNKDDDNKLTLKEFNEKLSELELILSLQEEFIKKEKNLEKTLSKNISKEQSEKFTLQQLASKLNSFCQHEEELEIRDYALKVKIQNHINEHLDNLHFFSNFVYHLLIGVILFELFLHEPFTAVTFFVFALFKAITSKTSNDIILFPGIEVHEEHNEPLYIKLIGASAALIGVFIGFILGTVFHISMNIIFLLFSFISGVILYTIIREVLPENESGRPLYFLLGIIIFLIIITLSIYLSTAFSTPSVPTH